MRRASGRSSCQTRFLWSASFELTSRRLSASSAFQSADEVQPASLGASPSTGGDRRMVLEETGQAEKDKHVPFSGLRWQGRGLGVVQCLVGHGWSLSCADTLRHVVVLHSTCAFCAFHIHAYIHTAWSQRKAINLPSPSCVVRRHASLTLQSRALLSSTHSSSCLKSHAQQW